MKLTQFKNWSIRAKIMSIVALVLVCVLLFIQFYFVNYFRNKMLEEKKESLTGSLEVMFSILNAYEQRAMEGEFKREEAQRRALRNIERLKYHGNNYFWITDIQPVLIMHPHRKDLVGQNVGDYEDENGKKLFLEFAMGCRDKGYSYVKYRWSNDGRTTQSKLGMSKLYKPWGWIIGTGIDIDMLNASIAKVSNRLMIFSVIFLLAVLLVTFFIADYITKPMKSVMKALNLIADGDYTVKIPEIGEDEMGRLIKQINHLSGKLDESFTKLNKTSESLKTAGAQLEMKNNELERFTYSVSHDLKSPLITIKGFCGLMEEDIESNDKERVLKDLAKIQKSADRMEALLDDLLQLSRVGQVVNPPQRISLNDIVKEVLEIMTGIIRKKAVKITVMDNMPDVMADWSRLSQVVQNLVENAVKFTARAENPTVEIGAKLQDDGKVLVFVKDNGIGVDPRYHHKIFELFSRLDTKTEGSGVGLALVKRIIEVHGGTIWVESEGNDSGSCFCFTLPVAREE